MKLFSLAAIAVCLVSGIVAADLPASLKPEPHQRDPYIWQDRHEMVLARHKEVKPEYVVIGDSITHKWGGEPSYGTGQVGKEAWDRLFGNYTATNMGFGFDYIDNAYFRVQNGELDGISPRVIILLIGTNNIGHRKDSAADCAANMKEFVKLILSKCPKSKVLILGVLPRKEEALAETIKKNNVLVAKLANNRNVFFADVGKALLEGKTSHPKNVYMADTVHLSKDGYNVLVDQLIPVLSKIDPLYKPSGKAEASKK